MTNFIKRHYPIIIVLLSLWTFTGITTYQIFLQNNHRFIYIVDDAYIHMAIVKNYIIHGNWGMNRYEFSSTSSSILWSLLLTFLYSFTGVDEYLPLIINLIVASGITIAIYYILIKFNFSQKYNLMIMLCAVWFSSLPHVLFAGMEHLLHSLLNLTFLYLAAVLLKNNNQAEKTGKFHYILMILGLLTVAARYEGAFLVFIACILFFIRKRYVYSFFLGVISISPVIFYGLYCYKNGAYFLPNTLLIKGNTPHFNSVNSVIDYSISISLNFIKNLDITLIIAYFLFYIKKFVKTRADFWQTHILMAVIFIFISVIHIVSFGESANYFRYKLYLSTVAFILIPILWREYLKKSQIVFNKTKVKIFIISLATLVFVQILNIQYHSLLASKNIYQQQIQMANFFKQYYTGQSIMLNDIGAVNFFADVQSVDLWGLGTKEVVDLILTNNYHPETMKELAVKRNTKVAIIYPKWFKRYDGIPKEWVEVGQWTIKNNIICGDETVSIYAVDPKEETNLIKHLKAFSIRLPKDIEQSGSYLQ